ncbi:HNH endonuclease [Streptomyces althioticus]|uniref:HNH endonuclease n=1 Tax=Streptomyces althioticus TaxID=83380 RepID=UPI0033C88316
MLDWSSEEWRPVPGQEGFYDVSSLGNVRTWILSGKYRTMRKVPKLMKPQKRPDGYWMIRLKEGEAWLIQHLVFEAFIGERAEGLHVRHLDGDQDNNHKDNLALGTPTENAWDKARDGTLPVGVKVHNAKLDDDKVREIRALLETMQGKDIAEIYGVSPGLIYQIKAGKIWRHVT